MKRLLYSIVMALLCLLVSIHTLNAQNIYGLSNGKLYSWQASNPGNDRFNLTLELQTWTKTGLRAVRSG